MNSNRNAAAGAGTTTAGISMGGQNPGKITNTETYDGTSWAEVNDLNTALSYNSAGGSQTACFWLNST